MSYPKLVFDLNKLKKNLDVLGEACHQANCTMMIVTKSFCADPNVIDMIDAHPLVDYLADSRVKNLKKMTNLNKEKVLLRIPQESELSEMVKYADISFQSEQAILSKTDAAAFEHGRKHKVVLMIDLGDLREGIFYKDKEKIFDTAKQILKSDNLILHGIATNLTCYGAIIPKPDNLSILVHIAKEIEEKFSVKLNMISGGNSSSYYLLSKSQMPTGINNLRLGEAFVLGNETAYGERIQGTYNDGIQLKAQIVELKAKPSMPIGESGVDAFGNKPVYEDRGIIERAILAVGQQDIDPGSITPTDPKVEILGASSDHMILDVSNSKKDYTVGDIMSFTLGYGGLLKAATSDYVYKEYI